MATQLFQQQLPADACSYWQRAQGRDADDDGFGCSPWSLMTPEQAEVHQLAREQEDDQDPPCGKCVCCLESAESADHDGPWNGGAEETLQRYPG